MDRISYYNKELHELNTKLLKVLPQIFIYKNVENEIPEAQATGVLVKKDNHFFLITARHLIFEDNQLIQLEHLGIMINDKVIRLNGQAIYTQDSSKEIDKLDILVLKLKPKIVKILKNRFSFLKLSTLDDKYVSADDSIYSVIGFPVSKTKLKNYKKTLETKVFEFVAKELSGYIDIKMKNPDKIYIDYRILDKNNSDRIIKSPNPIGLSGGGLWIMKFKTNKNRQIKLYPKLVGILTDWNQKNNYLTATHIKIVLEIMNMFTNNKQRHTGDDLKPKVPDKVQ